MKILEGVKKVWLYLKQDTWHSWLVSIILIILMIKFILFPVLSFITGTPLPLVVVESCSMYHNSGFNNWWISNSAWYENRNIEESDFLLFPLKNGLNKGDIVLVWGRTDYNLGDIVIFSASTRYPIIHRIVGNDPISTKGDNNSDQLDIERVIEKETIMGKAVGKVPLLGWIKLLFFESFKSPEERGFCK